MPVYKAPAGGAIVNNAFSRGGQFLPRPFARVRAVALALWRARLARKKPVEPSPIHELMAKAQVSPDAERFTLGQLRALEDTHNVAKKDRLSPHATVDAEGYIRTPTEKVGQFLEGLHRAAARNKGFRLSALSDEDAGAVAVGSLGAETQHALHKPHGIAAKEWYNSDIGKLHKAFEPLVGPATSPRWSLARALIALTSNGQDPVANAKIAHRMLSLTGGDISKIPERQTDKLAAWMKEFHKAHGVYPTDVPDARTDPEGAALWWKHHLEGRPELRTGYSGVPALLYRNPTDHLDPLNGAPVARDAGGKLVPYDTEKARAAQAKGRYTPGWYQKATLPLSAHGVPLAPNWNYRGEEALEPLRTLKKVIKHFGGDETKAAAWLLTEHDPSEFVKVTGKPPADSSDYLENQSRLPGSFALGPKLGSFFLNLHTPESVAHGRFLTADQWWSRTWNRFLGKLVRPRGGLQDSPRSRAERRQMYQAAKTVAAQLGLNVAELQAIMWYHEQRLYRMLGASAPSLSYADAARSLEK